MALPPRLLVFDIDGTLTNSARLTRTAFEIAAEEIYGIRDSTKGIHPHGKTDQGIFREILINNSLSVAGFADQFRKFTNLYALKFEPLIMNSRAAYLQPGVVEFLEYTDREDDLYLALGTGNTRAGAYLKLQAQGIDHFFPVGGFGDDHEERTELLRIGYERSCAHYSIEFTPYDTWIIGDTPHDIRCGKKLGLMTLAVATGGFCVPELEACDPTAVLEDLSDTKEVMSIIDNFHRSISEQL